MSKLGFVQYVLLVLAITCLSIFKGESQNRIELKCCGISKVIPNFVASPDSVLYDNVFIAKGVLKPIMQTSSNFEIRFYMTWGHEDYNVVVISCDNDQMDVSQYTIFPWNVRSNFRLGNTMDLGPMYYNKDITYMLGQTVTKYRLSKQFPTWNAYVDSLINKHLFDIKGDPFITQGHAKSMSKTGVTRYYPPLRFVEIKVGKYHRNIRYDGYLDPDARIPDNVKQYNNLVNCLSLLELRSFVGIEP